MTDETEPTSQPVEPAASAPQPEPPPLDQVEEGAEPNPLPPPDGTTRSFVVLHSNPEGVVFATRLTSTSKGNAIEAINEAHTDNTVLTVQEDVGQASVNHGDVVLNVVNLSDEP